MALYNINLFGGSEANLLNWSKLPDSIQLPEWFRDVPSCQTFTAHNSTEIITQYQNGGTFWIGIGQETQYITGSSKDPSGLGRWSVCTLLSWSGHMSYHLQLLPLPQLIAPDCRALMLNTKDILTWLTVICAQDWLSFLTWHKLLMTGPNKETKYYYWMTLTGI